MTNITNTQKHVKPHTHEKEDIKGLDYMRRIIPIQIGFDEDGALGWVVSRNYLDENYNNVEDTIGIKAETVQLGEILKPGDIVVLTNMGRNDDIYAPGENLFFEFQGCRFMIYKDRKFPNSGSLLLAVRNGEQGGPLILDIIGGLGMNYDGLIFYETKIRPPDFVTTKQPNTLYFITES